MGVFPLLGLVIMDVSTLLDCFVFERTLPVASPVEIGGDGEYVFPLGPMECGLR